MTPARANTTAPVLPSEIITQILSFLPTPSPASLDDCRRSRQVLLNSCCLVSRMWYGAAIEPLYESPLITGRNYEKIVATLCPSINAHVRKNGLANLVKTLDLHRLVYHGSKSKTARLLGRVKDQLEVLIAPQATFGVSSLAALGKCKNLRHLDLSLVSEALDPSDLARSLKNLIQLGFLATPRTGKIEVVPLIESLPPNLREYHLNCGLESKSYWPTRGPPPTQPNLTVTRLVLQDTLSRMPEIGFCRLVTCLPNLEYLKIGPPTTKRSVFFVGYLILSLNHLQYLRIPIDFLARRIFWEPPMRSKEKPSSLVEVELDRGFSVNDHTIIDMDIIWDAVTEGAFPNLRRIGLHRSLDTSGITEFSEGQEEVNQLLKAFAREDGVKAKVTEDLAGVYTFDD